MKLLAVAALVALCTIAHAAPPPWSHAGGNGKGHGHGHGDESHGNAPVAHVSGGIIVVVQGDTIEVHLNAKEQKGEVSGEATFTFATFFYTVDIDCLHVTEEAGSSEGAAWLSGVVSDATPGFVVIGSAVSFEVIDYGEGLGAHDEISRPVPGAVLPPCETEQPFPVFEILEGNIQVKGQTP